MERACDCLKAMGIAAAILVMLVAVLSMLAYAQEQPQEPEKPPVEKPEDAKQPEKAPEEPADGGEQEEKPRDAKEEGDKTGQSKKEEAQDKPLKFTKEQIERAYPVGERLTYSVSWKGIHAGTAVLEVNAKVRYKGRECFRIRSYTNSARAISLVYKVEDRLQTYVDAETLEPMRSDMKMREGSHRKEQYVIYSPSDRTAEYHKKKRGKFVLRRKHEKVPFGIQGALSSLYFLRTMNLELGKSYEMNILTGRRITKGVFEITKKKKIKIPDVGTFTGLRISPKYIEAPGEGKMKPGEGLFVASGDSEVWVDQATGIPLVMYVDIPLGSIRVQLTKKEKIEKKKKK